MHKHYDRKGQPLDLTTWALLSQDLEYQVVRRTEVGETLVSTVWLGIDLSFGESNTPLIFETMVFCESKDDPLDHMVKCHATEELAIAGHQRLVQQIQE